MRHLSDEELAKYFDDGTQEATPSGSPQGGWSLDDAFANPKQGRAPAVDETATSRPRSMVPDPETPVPLKRPRLSDRHLHPVSRVSRVSVQPAASHDLSWTGRDAGFEKKSGFSSKPILLMVGMVALCLVLVMMFSGGGSSGPVTGSLPQIGQ